MKLTNISLAILVAIGLVACGGSDDNKNQPTDNNNAGHQGAGNGNPPPPPPPKEKDVKDPDNRASALEVEKRLETNTAVAKTIYANRNGISTLAGYKNTDYQAGSVSTPDLLRSSSAINYLSEGWVNADGTLRLNPLQTYAKGSSGKFYRVIAVGNATGATQKDWSDAKPSDKFSVLGPDTVGNNPSYVPAGEFSDPYNIPATNLYFVPNAKLVGHGSKNDEGVQIDGGNNAYTIPKPPPAGGVVHHTSALGTITIDPATLTGKKAQNTLNNSSAYDIGRGQVIPSGVVVGGKTYTFDTATSSSTSFKLDLGLDNKEEIQTLPIKFNYTINDSKGTQTINDDNTAFRTTDAGELRVYNINYSSALLEVNQAAAKDSNDITAAARNGLGFEGTAKDGYIQGFGNISGEGINGRYGPFQVQGYKTTALPLNGRATYLGQSFGVNSKGKIDLDIDFGEDRAGIKGSVTERTTLDGKKKLDDMRLHPITLSQPGTYSLTGSVGINPNNKEVKNGIVDLGGQTNWGTWAVQLYGPNAENAAGVIAYDHDQLEKGKTGAGNELGNIVEVFNSARTDINPKSLNNPKNP